MIARFVYQALSVGWQTYLTQTELFGALFRDIWALGDDEVAAIVAYFLAQPPIFRHGYPRAALTDNPTAFLFTQMEAQPDFALNDFGGTPAAAAAQAAALTGSPVLSSYWTHNLQIDFWARGQPETAMWGYEVCKSILLAAKHYFLANAILNYSLSGGDAAPQSAYEPTTLFGRSLTFRCQRQFNVNDQSGTLAEALDLGAIVLPPGGDPLAGRPRANVAVALGPAPGEELAP